MRGEKYNPALGAMVGNYRELAKRNGVDLSHLSQQEVLDLINENTGFGTSEEDEEAFVEVVKGLYGKEG